MIHPDVFGLILAGGKSIRMGTDKSLLDYKGKPQREHLFEMLSTICEEVFTSCREDQNVPDSLHPLRDQFSYPGPISGILTGLKNNPKKAWLILAVDMPFVDEAALEFLLNHRDKNKVATCFLHKAEKFPEPLLTLWEPSTYELLEKFVARGGISPRFFLETSDVKTLLPPNEKILLNINYPKDRGPLL